MIIILEGADNSGKSTLAKRLASDLNLEVCHPGGPPKNIAEALARCVEQDAIFDLCTEVNFIYDRVTCISDMIYRGKQQYHNVFVKFMEKIRLKPNVLVVYCRPSNERLTNFDDHVMQDHEDEAVVQHAKDNVGRIIAEYDSLLYSMQLDKHFYFFVYNFETDEDSESYKELRSLIIDGID